MTDSIRQPRDIAVYGATGYTGGLVCDELARRNVDFAIGGRDEDRLEAVARRLDREFDIEAPSCRATVDDRDSLDRLADGTDVLINCAGPFVDIGRPVALAAVRNGADYVDVAGEQRFLRWVDRELEPVASERGLTLMPGCAFEFAAGSLAGRRAVDRGARHVALAYWFEPSWTSPGTKKSILRNLSEPGWAWENRREVRCRPASDVFDVPWPTGGTRKAVQRAGGASVILPKMGDVVSAKSAFVVGAAMARLLAALSPLLPRIASALSPVADAGLDYYRRVAGDQLPSEQGARFRVLAFDPEYGELLARLEGRDPYAVTARMVAESAERLLREEVDPGYVTPGSAWEPGEFAEAVGAELRDGR